MGCTRATDSFRFATPTGATGGGIAATCPARVGPLPPFLTGALRGTALSSEVCLPSGQSLQVWSREEEDLAGGAPGAQAERRAVSCVLGTTKKPLL